MSNARVKATFGVLLLMATGGLSTARADADPTSPVTAPAPQATCNFSPGFPKAGSVQGQLSISIDWANCTGVDLVVGGVSKTVNKQQVLIGKGVQVQGTAQAPLLTTGSNVWAYATGETTGTVVTSGTADAFKGAANLASNKGVALNVTIP